MREIDKGPFSDAGFGVSEIEQLAIDDMLGTGGYRFALHDLLRKSIRKLNRARQAGACPKHTGLAVVSVRAEGEVTLRSPGFVHSGFGFVDADLRDCARDLGLTPVDTIRRGGHEIGVVLMRMEAADGGRDFRGDVLGFSESYYRHMRSGAVTSRRGARAHDISIGAAILGEGCMSAEDLIEWSTHAMNAARYSGAPIMIHDAATAGRRRDSALACDEVLSAIDTGRVLVFYQPKLDLASRRVVGAEALVRLSRDGRVVAPGEFLPQISGHKAVVELDKAVMKLAIMQADAWASRGAKMSVALNMSARILDEPQLADLVLEQVGRCDLIDASQIEVEVTEACEIMNIDVAVSNVKRLREAGVRVLLDDFGVGYASFDYLKRVPLDGLKIDKQFVLGMQGCPKDMAVVESVCSIARAFRLDVIAEGVEHESDARTLLNLGVKQAQGFLFSPPVNAIAFEAFAARAGIAHSFTRSSR